MTILQEFYEKYESFRNSPTAEEHANKFLAWMLTRKEELIEREKQFIIGIQLDYLMKDHGLRMGLEYYNLLEEKTNEAEKYYESLKTK